MALSYRIRSVSSRRRKLEDSCITRQIKACELNLMGYEDEDD